jgi:glycosyltransferase involved in cell wall biosynthesis
MSSELLTVSAVIPVHNEEYYLRYTLPAYQRLRGVDECVFVLDDCTDRSEAIIRHWFPNAVIHVLHDWHKWPRKVAESFQYGFEHSIGDIIMAMGADLIFPPTHPNLVKQLFQSDPLLGTVCFRYYNDDVSSRWIRVHGFYDNLYRSLVERIRSEARHTGVYALRRSMMEEIGPLSSAIISEYDEYMRRVKASRWHYQYCSSTNIKHLRAGLTKSKQLVSGQSRAMLPQYNLWKTLFHSLIHIKPYVLQGYITERLRTR